jgi:serine protease AprX
LTTLASDSATCPFCGRPIHPALLPFGRDLQPHILRRLRSQQPGWKREEGVCPACVFRAVQQAQKERSTYSLHLELRLPYPVYAPDQVGVLPTPLRVRANPRYAGQGTTIAFIDSGFYSHPDLIRPQNRISLHVDTRSPEAVEREHFRKPQATSWHGLMTSCVGTGNGFMASGLYRGVASRAKVVLVKTGNRRNRRIREQDIYRSLTWVMANHQRLGIRVVNLSVGGDHPSTGALSDLDQLAEDAVAEGLVVVAAAGNGGQERILPPASAPSAISVGGLDDQNSLDPRHRRMYASNYGRGARGVRKPDVIAPAIWLAAPMLPRTWVHNEALVLWHLEHASDKELARLLQTEYVETRFKKDTLRRPLDEIRHIIRQRMIEQKYIHPHYQHVDGTSMAAPIVSAIAAQMLEANPNLSPVQVRELIRATAERLPDVPPAQQGAGAVNAARALAAALRAPGGPLAGLPPSPDVARRSVSFYYHDEAAQEVAVVGSFNDWQPHPLRRRVTGVWQITLPRPRTGTHLYKLLIDSSHWINDPANGEVAEDGYGGYHSVVEL